MRRIHECRARPSAISLPSLRSRRSEASRGPRRSSAFRSRRSATPSAGSKNGSGLRLLTRTTRSVAPTEAGERLLRTVGPAVRRDRVRAGGLERAARQARRHHPHHGRRARGRSDPWPALAALLPNYPDIKIEIIVDYGLTDIVAERYDAGVRLGEQVAKDMIAVRIGPDHAHGRRRIAGLFRNTAQRPKTPQDLTAHNCINLRLPTYGGLYAWEFEKGGRELKVRVDGQIVFNHIALRIDARRWRGLALPTCPRNRCRPTSRRDGLSASWPIGARPSPATISITRAGASPPRPLPSSSRRSATAREGGGHIVGVRPGLQVAGRSAPHRSYSRVRWPRQRPASKVYDLGADDVPLLPKKEKRT